MFVEAGPADSGKRNCCETIFILWRKLWGLCWLDLSMTPKMAAGQSAHLTRWWEAGTARFLPRSVFFQSLPSGGFPWCLCSAFSFKCNFLFFFPSCFEIEGLFRLEWVQGQARVKAPCGRLVIMLTSGAGRTSDLGNPSVALYSDYKRFTLF